MQPCSQKHEETGGFLTENGMKMLAEGVVHLGKMPVTDGKDLSSVCVHIPEHTRSFNRQAYTNLKISTVR